MDMRNLFFIDYSTTDFKFFKNFLQIKKFFKIILKGNSVKVYQIDLDLILFKNQLKKFFCNTTKEI